MASRRSIRRGLTVLGVALVASGIAFAWLPRRVELELGPHQISVLRPRGFEVVRQGEACLLRDGPILLELADLGAPGGDPVLGAPLDEWVDWGLRTLDSSKQREVARRDTLAVGEIEFRIVESWDRLTHGQKRRFAFLLNGDALLVLHTRGGDFDEAAVAFDQILESFELVASGAGQDSASSELQAASRAR